MALQDFLQMGYISVIPESGFTWQATQELKIYAVLAIPLLAFTMLLYVGIEAYKGRRKQGRVLAPQGSIV